MAVLSSYVYKTGISELMAHLNPVKANRKGTRDVSVYHQILMFLMEGSSSSLEYFNTLADDEAYRACIGVPESRTISSHAIKRFFHDFTRTKNRRFRSILMKLFAVLLMKSQPTEVVLDIDSVVYDNDDALTREGSSPTYKKVKGFQPLLVKWGSFVVWADFRTGSTHCNRGNGLKYALVSLVKIIRQVLGDTIPIRVTMDAGFFDADNFTFMEKVLNIEYVCSGKLYGDLASRLSCLPPDRFTPYLSPSRDVAIWEYTEILDCRISWSELRRVIYTRRTRTVSGQMEFFGPDALYYTNIAWSPERIIDLAHSRGEAELVHRRLKDFADETLPFKRFALNEAWFYLMLIAFDLFQMVKEEKDAELETASMYPTTFRRGLIDTAGKIVRHAGKTILKTTKNAYACLSILWDIAAPALYPITP